MEFSSLYFLYLFLPLTLLAYFLVPGLRLKNIVLLAASLYRAADTEAARVLHHTIEQLAALSCPGEEEEA